MAAEDLTHEELIAEWVDSLGASVLNVTFLCCFCGEDASDHTAYGISSQDGQVWWCHRECFVDALHPTARTGPVLGEGE